MHASPKDLDLDSPAWRFALDLYRRPGVADECLRLQDEAGLDVNFLLFALWLGAERAIALDEASFAEARALASDWAGIAVHPLRAARRGVKLSPEIERPAVQAFRAKVQRIEIEAERLEIALLHEWAIAGLDPPPARGGGKREAPDGGGKSGRLDPTRLGLRPSPPSPGREGSGAAFLGAALANLRLVLGRKGTGAEGAAAIPAALRDRVGDRS